MESDNSVKHYEEPQPWWPIFDGSSLLRRDALEGTSTFIPKKAKISSLRKTVWRKSIPIPFFRNASITNRVNSFREEDLEQLVLDELTDLEEPLRSNYHSFLINLWSYSIEVDQEYRHVDIESIHRRSLTEGASFAQWMDKHKSYILGLYSDREYFSDEIYSLYHPLPLRTKEEYVDLSGIYRSNSLFEWKPDRPNLIEICAEPVIIEDSVLEEFRLAARDYLDNSKFQGLQMPCWKELVGPSDKKTTHGPYWQAEDCAPSRVRGKSVLVYVDRELKGARAAVKEDYGSVLRIRWIERSVQKILALDSRDVSKNQASILKNKLKRACLKDGYSYCRDFNKEGLTKPRIICRVLLEELFRASGWESFESVGFFDDWTYIEEGEEFSPPRGHGLGMANALTTLMSIIIEEVCSRRVGYRPNWSGYNNDDAATYFIDRKHAINYATEDRKICDDLGLDFKPKASFISKEEIVLCEQYWCLKNRNYGWKGSFYTEAFFGLLKCTNASEAKFRASSTDVTYIPDDHMNFVISYWGWTLYRNEQSRVKTFGGWFPLKIKNVDLTFSKIKSTDVVPREEYSSWKAISKVQLEIRPWDKRKANNRLYLHYPEEFLEVYEIPREYKIGSNARTKFDPDETERMWVAYQRRLREEFSVQTSLYDRMKNKPIYNEVYLQEAGKNPLVDYIPPTDKRWGETCLETTVKDWHFNSPYVNLGMEFELDLWKMRPHECNNINEGRINLSLNKYGEGYRGACKRAKELGLEGWETYALPGPAARENFTNPYAYIRVCDMMGSNYKSWIRTDVIPEKDSYLEGRNRLYNRERLILDDWAKIGSLGKSEIYMIRKIYEMGPISESELEGLIAFCKKFPGSGFSTQGAFKMSQIIKTMMRFIKQPEEPEWDFPIFFNSHMEQTYPYSWFSGSAPYPDIGFEEMSDEFSVFDDFECEEQFEKNYKFNSGYVSPGSEEDFSIESDSWFDPSVIDADEISVEEFDWEWDS